MTDHNPLPRCPYCGTPMVGEEKMVLHEKSWKGIEKN